MLSQSHSTLELHQRVLADLDQREAAVVEKEAEARRVLEQALAHCAAERTSIEQDRAVTGAGRETLPPVHRHGWGRSSRGQHGATGACTPTRAMCDGRACGTATAGGWGSLCCRTVCDGPAQATLEGKPNGRRNATRSVGGGSATSECAGRLILTSRACLRPRVLPLRSRDASREQALEIRFETDPKLLRSSVREDPWGKGSAAAMMR